MAQCPALIAPYGPALNPSYALTLSELRAGREQARGEQAEKTPAKHTGDADDQQRGPEIPSEDHRGRIMVVEQRERARRDGRYGETSGRGDGAGAQHRGVAQHHGERDRKRHAGEHEYGETSQLLAEANALGPDADPIRQAAIADGGHPSRERRHWEHEPPPRAILKADHERRDRRQ